MQTGDVVGERFEIEAEAGAGGMGVVYRARDRTTGTTVALKVMHTLGEEGARRLEREATALAGIAHPSIVRYVAHGPSWIAMEWLEGEDLKERLERRGLTVAESVALAHAVAAGLGAAHARGIVHRDVKPANVWLVGGETTQVKLLDFGIARARVLASMTRLHGTRAGTRGAQPRRSGGRVLAWMRALRVPHRATAVRW
jgi:serine/threonine protein kinase